MVFGLFDKEIELALEKTYFKPGELIRGHISLTPKRPVKARQLRVFFFGERTVRVMERNNKGRMQSHNRTDTVYRFEQKIDEEKEYSNAEYDFEIKVPETLFQALPEGALGTAVKVFQMFQGSSPVKWYVEAQLDIPMGFDIKKKVQITVG